MRGRIDAEIVQACVVTLEPLTNTIAEEIDTIFVPENSRLARIELDESGEILLDAEGADIPETFVGDRIDVGAVAEEFLIWPSIPIPASRGCRKRASQKFSVMVMGMRSPFHPLRNFQNGRKSRNSQWG